MRLPLPLSSAISDSVQGKRRDKAPKIKRNTLIFPFPIKNVLCPGANIRKAQWSLGIHGGLAPRLLQTAKFTTLKSLTWNTTIHSACHIHGWASSDSTSYTLDWLKPQTKNRWIWRTNSTKDQRKLQERQSGEELRIQERTPHGHNRKQHAYPPALRLALEINKNVCPYNQQKNQTWRKVQLKVQSDSQNRWFSEYMKGYLHY